MALFQKHTINDQLVHIVREEPVAANDEGGLVKLIVGLGNIGKEFVGTRHNIGFEVVDAFARHQDFPKWQEKKKFKCNTTERFMNGQKIILAKPTTYMNASGDAVKALCDFYKIAPRDVIVIHDELDLPFETVKTKRGGGSAGNNGIKSIIAAVGEDFARIRIGIKNDQLEKVDTADFVLAKFSSSEQAHLQEIITEAVSKII
jgi:peptidyl-tRNA hydrolase, PTH1 family